MSEEQYIVHDGVVGTALREHIERLEKDTADLKALEDDFDKLSMKSRAALLQLLLKARR